MSNSAYFIQYHFNIIPVTCIRLLDALSVETRTNFFGNALRQLMTSICFKIGLDLARLILILSFKFFCQLLLRWQTSTLLKIPQISFYQTTTFL